MSYKFKKQRMQKQTLKFTRTGEQLQFARSPRLCFCWLLCISEWTLHLFFVLVSLESLILGMQKFASSFRFNFKTIIFYFFSGLPMSVNCPLCTRKVRVQGICWVIPMNRKIPHAISLLSIQHFVKEHGS